MFDTIIQKIMAFTNTRYVKIISSAFMSIAAVSIAGSLFNLLKSFPVSAYQDFLANTGLGDILAIPADVASNFIAVLVILAIGYETAKSFGKQPFPVAIVAFASFMILTPNTAMTRVLDDAGEMSVGTALNVVSLSNLGAQGIFLAMLAGLLASRLYIFFLDRGWTIKLPDSVPPAVSQMFETMIPGGITFLVFIVLRFIFQLTPFGTAQAFIYGVLQTPLMGIGGSVGGAIAYLTIGKLLWLFGVHGDMVMYSAMGTITSAANADNMAAFAAGTPAPYQHWALVYIVMNIGALAMALDLIIFGKSVRYKETSKVAVVPAVFNITEPSVFGYPLIMNPITAVPYVITPAVNLLVCLALINLGIMAPMTGVSNATVLPAPISLALGNASWTGALVGVALIALDMLIYLPFVKALDNSAVRDEQAAEADEAETAAEAQAA